MWKLHLNENRKPTFSKRKHIFKIYRKRIENVEENETVTKIKAILAIRSSSLKYC